MPSTPTSNVVSTLTGQKLINYARAFAWTRPTLGVAGYSDEPALSFLNEVLCKIMSTSNPWKWNAAKFPAIETQPYQQDYPTSISQADLSWLQAGVIVDINNPNWPQGPAIIPITCVTSLLPTYLSGVPQKICWVSNSVAQTGTWPGPNTEYKQPLNSLGGGPGSNPLTAITDANGNIQVVTTYGVTGSSEPSWPGAGTAPGTQTTDGSVIWTLIDPLGVALRLDALATYNSNVWELRVVYQKQPPTISSLGQTIAPVPKSLDYLVKQGFLAYCYQQVDEKKFETQIALFLADIQRALGSNDREIQEFGFFPASPLQGVGPSTGGGTFGYPGWPGWTSGG